MSSGKSFLPAVICITFYSWTSWSCFQEFTFAQTKAETILHESLATARNLLDLDAYTTLLRQTNITRDEYNSIIAPLVQYHLNQTFLAHLYTVTRLSNGAYYTILDTGKRVKELNPNHPWSTNSEIQEIAQPDPGILRALTGKESTEREKPLRKEYGADIAHYIPLINREGNNVGILAGTINHSVIAQLKLEALKNFARDTGFFTLLLLTLGIKGALQRRETRRQQQARLRAEQMFDTLSSKMQGAFLVFETNPRSLAGHLLLATAGVKSLLQITPEEAKSEWHEITHFLPETARDAETNKIEIARLNHSVWETEFFHPTSRLWLQVKATPQIDNSGRVLWYALLSDITPQKTESKQLAETNAVLKQISEEPNSETTLSSICTLARSRGQKYAVIHLFEDSRIATSIHSTLPKEIETLLAASTPKGPAAIASLQHDPLFIPSIENTPFYKHAEPFRKALLAENISCSRLHPLISKTKICLGILEIFYQGPRSEDDNEPQEHQAARLALAALERRASFKEAQEQERRYRTLFQNLPIGILETDRHGELHFANEEVSRITNAETQYFLSQNIGKEGTLEIKQGDNTLLAHTTEIETSAGEIHFITAISDITEQKQREEQALISKQTAEEANRQKTEFVAMISHEIRTPMNGILGMAQQLNRIDLPPHVSEKIKLIERCGQTLLSIINSILDLSKVEAGKLELENRPFPLLAPVESVVNTLTYTAQQKNITLSIRPTTPLPTWITGDESKIAQIVLNLAGNAVKFTETGGVTIHLTHFDGTLTITVEDTGIGIPTEKQARLFQPFTQADSSTTRKFGGTGLGLVISKNFTEAMGGSIELQSKEGIGTKIRVTIPAPATETPEKHFNSPETHPNPTPQPPQKLHILIAEDSSTNLFVLTGILEALGHTYTTVENGLDALEMVRNDGTLFDLVLMDMQMPIMDGLQSTIEIRKLETLQSQAHSDNQPFSPIPICALTADAMSGARETILGAGFNAYFSKPLDFQQFETFLAQCPKRAKPKTNPLPAENNPPDHPNGEPFTTDPSIHPRNGLHPSTHQTTDSSLHHPTTTTTETLTLLTSKTTTPNPPFPPEQQTDQTITEHTGPDSQEISVSLSDPTNSTPEANNKENPSPNPHSQIPTGPQTTQPDTPTAPPSPDLETQSTKQPEPQPIFNPETLGNLTKYITPARLIDTVIPEAMVIGNDCIQTLLSIETTQREKAEAAHKMRGSLGSIGMEAIFRLTSKIEAHYEEAITNEVQDPYPDIHQIKTLFEQSQTLLDLHLETLRNTQV